MTKRSLLLVLLCCAWTIGALGQSNPWNCNSQANRNLICLLPVATRSLGSVNSPAPTFNSAFATQLGQLPLVSSASGLNVEFTAQGPHIVSENLGPILTDRAETIGRHKLFLGFFYQRFRFNSIDGTNIKQLPFVFFTSSGVGQGGQYTVVNESLDFKLDQYVGLITFGLTDKADVSVIIPIERVSMGASSSTTIYSVGPDGSKQGTPAGPIPQYTSGSASGVGDVIANVKYRFWGKEGEPFQFAGGMFLRFPSGDALNYLGSGAYGFNPYAVVSYQWKVAPHAKIGYVWNTNTVLIPTPNSTTSQLPGGFQYDLGADWSIARQLTLAFDFFGNQFLNSPSLVQKTTSIPAFGVMPPGLTPTTSSYQVNDFSLGAKWAPFARKNQTKPLDNLILYGNALFQMNNVGLRSNVVPLFGISYKFGL